MKSCANNKDGENYREAFSAFLKLLFSTFFSNLNFLYTGNFACVQQCLRMGFCNSYSDFSTLIPLDES